MARPFLIIRLQAPMMSFGTVAVDNHRPSSDMPDLSMLTGVLARALGWNRPEHHPLIQRLQNRVSYAARAERLNHDGNASLIDYQSADLPRTEVAWTTTGRPDTRAGADSPNTFKYIRYAEYRTDLRVTVALELIPADDEPRLQDLAHALQFPKGVMFIGRKNCLPTHHIFRSILQAENTLDALHQTPSISPDPDDPVLWSGDIQHPSTTLLQTLTVPDIRDWANGIHTGRRTVATGTMTKLLHGETE